MSKCLVTGATGLVGSHIAAQLHTQGHEVVATYHTTEPDYLTV